MIHMTILGLLAYLAFTIFLLRLGVSKHLFLSRERLGFINTKERSFITSWGGGGFQKFVV